MQHVGMIFAKFTQFGLDRFDEVTESGFPHSVFLHPVYEQIYPFSGNPAAILIVALPWKGFLEDLVPDDSRVIYAVIENT